MTEVQHLPTPASEVYPASPIKRRRATKAEMEERARFLIDYANTHGPVTVRGLYYQAEVAGLPGITKKSTDYDKIQAQVLKLRREGRMPYEAIADATRWMRRPRTYHDWQDALIETARTYRRTMWRDAPVNLEFWLEKDALAGVIHPVTSEYDVPLMVTRGFSSETFAYEAVKAHEGSDRPYVVAALYDFDRAGHDAARSLREKVKRFAEEIDVEVRFHLLALNYDDVKQRNLPTRPPKRETAADRRWPYSIACELDAIPPDDLRELVRGTIEEFLPREEVARIRRTERMERETLYQFMRGVDGMEGV